MSKRPAAQLGPPPGEAPRPDRFVKRQKTEAAPNIEEIHSRRQLQQLLAFQQDSLPQLKTGHQSFKAFLESILYPTDEATVTRNQAILREYLEAERPKDLSEKTAVFLPQIFQSWAFAADTGNEDLLISIVPNIALLIKTLSHRIESREDGVGICRTVLQRAHLKLVSRALSAERHKERIISPALRLLTEIVSFDAGALARQVYSRRDFTFDAKILSRNLSLSRTSEGPDGKRKPSIRSNAVRYLLAHFKYQGEGPKIDILKNGNIARALFDHIKDDPPALAVEILDAVKNGVIMDASVPRNSKSYLLTERTLTNIAALYRVSDVEEGANSIKKKPIDQCAHAFLLLVCTNADMGVMLPSSGWYPFVSDSEIDDERTGNTQAGGIDLGFDSLDLGSGISSVVRVRNTVLSEFTQRLRPYANILEQDLLLAIFKASPELVADYFSKKSSFAFDPKLTATWIGYASFLFSIVQIPVPSFLGHKNGFSHIPPPVKLVIESILPRPLTQKALTRCLSMIQTSELINFFAVRILIGAFQKLQTVLRMFKQASGGQSPIWDQASKRLVAEFCQKCPKIKDVVNTFRRTPAEKHMQREAVTRLLALYYTVVPQAALDEHFDIALPLTTSLAALDNDEEENDDRRIKLLQLHHLLQIAQVSASINWWQKPEQLQLSPFTTLLRIISRSTNSEASLTQINELIAVIVRDHGIVQLQTNPTSLDAIIHSLQKIGETSNSNNIFEFLDECLRRVVSKPIKYQDDLEGLVDSSDSGPASLLLSALVEQWDYRATSSKNNESVATIGNWLISLLTLLRGVGEDSEVLSKVESRMGQASSKIKLKDTGEKLRSGFKKVAKKATEANLMEIMLPNQKEKSGTSLQVSSLQNTAVDLEIPPEESDNHPSLTKWTRLEAEEIIEEGEAGELILCLCSQHLSIRREALGNLRKLMKKIEDAQYDEWEQINLLLSEVVETARPIVDSKPLPYVAGILAGHTIKILTDPAHFLYPKSNKFLNKGPSWRIGKLLSYWADKVLLHPPSEDDAYYTEVEWLLDYFIDCLRTPEDMDLFRASNVFERILAVYDYDFVPAKVKEKLVRLLFRAAAVNGSTALITRSGILNWIKAHVDTGGRQTWQLRRLAERLYETCDQERVEEWSGGVARRLVEGLSNRT